MDGSQGNKGLGQPSRWGFLALVQNLVLTVHATTQSDNPVGRPYSGPHLSASSPMTWSLHAGRPPPVAPGAALHEEAITWNEGSYSGSIYIYLHTYTHTHIYIYIQITWIYYIVYIYIYIYSCLLYMTSRAAPGNIITPKSPEIDSLIVRKYSHWIETGSSHVIPMGF